jgi:citrate synthase
MAESDSPTLPFIPGLAGVPAAESRICYIDGIKGVLEYRGYPIQDLAERCSYEEVAYLLIRGRLPSASELAEWRYTLSRHRRIKYKLVDLLKCLPETGHPMEALQAGVAALGMFYPGKKKQEFEPAVRLLAKLPTIVAAYHRLRFGDEHIRPRDDLGYAENFLYMLTEHVPEPFEARVFDTALVLHAEHSMNASTFSARVTASTEADAYSVMSSAIGTLTGPLHGGANERVIEMLREIGSVDRVAAWLTPRVAAKQKIMGFGHRIYKTKDPRATILQRLAKELADAKGGTPLYGVAVELERQLTERLGGKGVYPNVDFYSGILYDLLGIPPDLFTPLFAIARVAGWLAHWREQMEDNRIFRPNQIYRGERKLKVPPVEARG